MKLMHSVSWRASHLKRSVHTWAALAIWLGSLVGRELYAWQPTGSMATSRMVHEAILLQSGKVLVAGGYRTPGSDSSVLNSSAELYDPAAGAWTTTGALPAPRIYFTLTLLPGGKVLAAGGTKIGDNITESDLYDPNTEQWTPSGSLNFGRYAHTATLLQNGKVLVAGGTDQQTYARLSSAELYDPETGTWTATGSLTTSREGATATLLRTGLVLVAGGDNGYGGTISSAELYDPATGIWIPTSPLNTARVWHKAVLQRCGNVLVAAGGGGSSSIYSSAEVYSPETGTWSYTPSMISEHLWYAGTLLYTGKMLAAGGYDSANTVTAVAELYDPAAGTWTATDSMSTQRRQHTITLLPNGKVLAAGGYNQSTDAVLSSAEIYDSGAAAPTPPRLNAAHKQPDGSFQFAFTNSPGVGFTVLASTNLQWPLADWTCVGSSVEVSSGHFQVTDIQATNAPQLFYRVMWP